MKPLAILQQLQNENYNKIEEISIKNTISLHK